CCGQSPVITINDDIYGYLTQEKIPDILASYT
ncbi:MAG: NAD(P)H-dependent oxidoreductase subunit E, partial [Anaerolineales bacterium]|nr:NAD(P)H-dependent oxidoreductase subunit E [Anaerolineales bacterium]